MKGGRKGREMTSPHSRNSLAVETAGNLRIVSYVRWHHCMLTISKSLPQVHYCIVICRSYVIVIACSLSSHKGILILDEHDFQFLHFNQRSPGSLTIILHFYTPQVSFFANVSSRNETSHRHPSKTSITHPRIWDTGRPCRRATRSIHRCSN